jgi:putative oxidoreductase
VIAASIFMAHGAQKLFGAFGGPGLEMIMSTQGPGGGGIIGLLVAIGEFFGGLGILVGVLPRFSAAANIAIMLGAILLVHGKNGLFGANGGFEFNLALIGLLLPILALGPGRFAASQFVALPSVKTRGSGAPAAQ